MDRNKLLKLSIKYKLKRKKAVWSKKATKQTDISSERISANYIAYTGINVSTSGRDNVFIRTVEGKNSWSVFRNPYLSSWLESTPINIAGYISILGYDTQNICNSHRRLGET
jgi:hypothetical protein